MKRSRRNGCRRNRGSMRGGTGSFAYTIGQAVAPGAPYASEIVRFPACENATRPGYIEGGVSAVGLPGFSGKFIGGRRRRGKKTMRGGRYTTTFETVGPAGIALANHQSIMCDTPRVNPLNPVVNTVTAVEPSAPLPQPGAPFGTQSGGARRRIGCFGRRGNKTHRCWTGGVGGVDSMVYEAPRAGYTHMPSDMAGSSSGTLADGRTPFLLNVPYDPTIKASSACMTTGGARKKSRKSRKSRRGRKH